MRASVLVAGALIALALFAMPASGGPLGPAGAAIACDAGFKRAVVGGKFTCLKPGRRCSAAHRVDYARSGLVCRAGRLKVRPATTTSATPASARGSSRTNPVPLGQPGNLGNGWTMTVATVNLDATSPLLAADPGNKPPPAGFQYVLVSVTATYGGAAGSHLNPASSLRATGASGATYTTFNSFCGVLPAPNLDLDNPLVFTGGTLGGYGACWSVPKADVASLVMYYQPLFGNTQVWFALR